MAGEDKKTLTIFSTLAKNSVKFFSPNRFTRAFVQPFALTRTLPQPPQHVPVNAKRRQDFSCRQAVSAITFPGNRKVSAVRSSTRVTYGGFKPWKLHQ